MKMLKKISLALVAVIFSLSMFVIAGEAQPGHAKWHGNQGRHLGWNKGRRRGWNNGRKTGWRWHLLRRSRRHHRY
jgi:hypothetical protein